MRKKFSLDFYTKTGCRSFPFDVISNNKNLDECLYDIYVTVIKQLCDKSFYRYPILMGRMLEAFDIYLNEIDETTDDVTPILVSTDDDVIEVLTQVDMKISTAKHACWTQLTELINTIEYETLHGNKNSIDEFNLVWIQGICPKWLPKVSFGEMKFKILTQVDMLKFTANIVFAYDNHETHSWYRIYFNSTDWENLIHGLNYDFDCYFSNIIQSLSQQAQYNPATHKVYGGGINVGKTITNSVYGKLSASGFTGGLHQLNGVDINGLQLNSFADTSNIYPKTIVTPATPVENKIIYTGTDGTIYTDTHLSATQLAEREHRKEIIQKLMDSGAFKIHEFTNSAAAIKTAIEDFGINLSAALAEEDNKDE